MLRFLRNLSVRRKIEIVCALSFLGMAFFAIQRIQEKRTAVDEMRTLQQLTRLSVHVGSFVHESQKERGASSVFLGSKGTKFRDELAAQRKRTDLEAASLTEKLSQFDAQKLGPRFVEQLGIANKDFFEKMASHRGSVDALSISGPEGVGFYTKMHSAFLNLIVIAAAQSTNAEIATSLFTFSNLLKAKESCGIERALGANAFAQGKFPSMTEFRKFVSSINTQETLLGAFHVTATAESRGVLEETLKGPIADEAERMRTIALQGMETGDFQEVDSTTWFQTMTQKIDLLQSVEKQIASSLVDRTEQIQSSAEAAMWASILSLAAVASAVLALSWYVSKLIEGPLKRTAIVLEAVAGGDLTQSVNDLGEDEIGKMGRALNRTVDGMKTSFGSDKVDWDEIARQKAQKAEAERREKEVMDNLKKVLDTVSKNASGIAAASEELSSVSTTMSDNATQTSSQTQLVSGSAESVSRNVQTVAAGAEQMTASIREISKNASEAAKIANNAVRVAQTTNVSVSKLGDSSQEIGEVIKVINSIAEQTNLLALNATIEAARAGEAGKGFAVVANEVKELAKETSKATENISRKIEGIQGDTKTAVDAIAEISGVINQINEISNSIAAAVEEQTATTNEMGRNLSEAARRSAEMVQSLGSVTQVAQSTTSGASDTQKAAAELAKMASELQQVVMR